MYPNIIIFNQTFAFQQGAVLSFSNRLCKLVFEPTQLSFDAQVIFFACGSQWVYGFVEGK